MELKLQDADSSKAQLAEQLQSSKMQFEAAHQTHGGMSIMLLSPMAHQPKNMLVVHLLLFLSSVVFSQQKPFSTQTRLCKLHVLDKIGPALLCH